MGHTLQLATQFCRTNGPLRWLPSRLVDHHLLRRPYQQQQQQQQQSTSTLLLQYRLLQHLLLSICHPKGSKIDRLAGVSHATAAVLIPGSTTVHTKVNVAATFGQKVAPVWANFTKF